MPAGALAATFPRPGSTIVNQGVLASGRLHICTIDLDEGVPITSITFKSGTTAAGTPTNQWFAFFDLATRTLLRQTVDDGATAWAASTKKTLALTSQYLPTYSGDHYVGIMVAAAQVPTLMVVGNNSVANVEDPVTSGASTTGLTTTAPATALAPTAATGHPFAWVS